MAADPSEPAPATPRPLRERVRRGIVEALRHELDRRVAGRLVGAGVLGGSGALGALWIVSDHPLGHHPDWHAAAFAAVWTALLVVVTAFVLLDLRTSSLPLSKAAGVALVGLGVAGLCGAACPDGHFLNWWLGTEVGDELRSLGGLPLSALCFGVVTSLAIAAISAALAPGRELRGGGRPALAAALLVLLLAPGVALQSVGTSWQVFLAWLGGTAAGAYLGLAGVLAARFQRPGAPPD